MDADELDGIRPEADSDDRKRRPRIGTRNETSALGNK